VGTKILSFAKFLEKRVFDHQFDDVSYHKYGFRQKIQSHTLFLLSFILRRKVVVFVEINDGQKQTKE